MDILWQPPQYRIITRRCSAVWKSSSLGLWAELMAGKWKCKFCVSRWNLLCGLFCFVLKFRIYRHFSGSLAWVEDRSFSLSGLRSYWFMGSPCGTYFLDLNIITPKLSEWLRMIAAVAFVVLRHLVLTPPFLVQSVVQLRMSGSKWRWADQPVLRGFTGTELHPLAQGSSQFETWFSSFVPVSVFAQIYK